MSQITTYTHNFTEAGVGPTFSLGAGESATYAVTTEESGGFVGKIRLERGDSIYAFEIVVEAESTLISGTVKNETTHSRFYRFVADDIDESDEFTGDIDATIGETVPAGLPAQIKKVSVRLSNDQIKSLPTMNSARGFPLVPAKERTSFVPIMAYLAVDHTAGDYTNIDVASVLSVNGGAAFTASVSGSSMLSSGTVRECALGIYSDNGLGSAAGGPGVDALYLNATNDNEDFTGGHAANTLTATVLYIEVDLA
jgi:hypothetical protein